MHSGASLRIATQSTDCFRHVHQNYRILSQIGCLCAQAVVWLARSIEYCACSSRHCDCEHSCDIMCTSIADMCGPMQMQQVCMHVCKVSFMRCSVMACIAQL